MEKLAETITQEIIGDLLKYSNGESKEALLSLRGEKDLLTKAYALEYAFITYHEYDVGRGVQLSRDGKKNFRKRIEFLQSLCGKIKSSVPVDSK